MIANPYLLSGRGKRIATNTDILGLVVDSEFPALGGQPQNTNVQPWNRIGTQSPSSQNRPPQQDDLFSSMDNYRIGGNGGGGGQGQGQGRQQMQPNSLDDFPALPRTAQNGDHMEDRGFMGMGGMAQYGATRQANNMSAAGRSGLGMGNGPSQSRLLDVMQQQPGGVQMSDVEKKVGALLYSGRVCSEVCFKADFRIDFKQLSFLLRNTVIMC